MEERLWDKVKQLTRNKILLGALLNGKMRVKLFRGLIGGYYEGNGMMRLDNGSLVDCDPSALTGIVYEDVIPIGDAETRMIIENLSEELATSSEELKDLQNQSNQKDKEFLEVVEKLRALEAEASVEVEKAVDELLPDSE